MVSRSGFQGSPWADLGPTCLPPSSSPMAAAPTAGKPILSLASRVNIRGSRRVYAHSTLLTSSMFNRCSFCICLKRFQTIIEPSKCRYTRWGNGMKFTYTIDEEAKYMYKYKYTYKHKYINKRIYGRRMCTALAMRPSIRGRVHPSERWPLLKQGIVKQSSLD